MAEEMLDVLAADGTPSGIVKARALVHQDGDLHRTCHVWIARRNGAGFDLLVQKRSRNKDSYPGCYDISSAGHIPAGVDYIPSAIRELREELGIHAEPDDLTPLFFANHEKHNVFHGKPFHDRERSLICLYTKPVDLSSLALQQEEVESVRWMDIEEVLSLAESHSPLTCIHGDDIAKIRDYLHQ